MRFHEAHEREEDEPVAGRTASTTNRCFATRDVAQAQLQKKRAKTYDCTDTRAANSNAPLHLNGNKVPELMLGEHDMSRIDL